MEAPLQEDDLMSRRRPAVQSGNLRLGRDRSSSPDNHSNRGKRSGQAARKPAKRHQVRLRLRSGESRRKHSQRHGRAAGTSAGWFAVDIQDQPENFLGAPGNVPIHAEQLPGLGETLTFAIWARGWSSEGLLLIRILISLAANWGSSFTLSGERNSARILSSHRGFGISASR